MSWNALKNIIWWKHGIEGSTAHPERCIKKKDGADASSFVLKSCGFDCALGVAFLVTRGDGLLFVVGMLTTAESDLYLD